MASTADESLQVDSETGADAPRSNGTADVELQELRAVAATKNNNVTEEESVTCVVTDETSTEWQKSRYSYGLPLSSDVGQLYSTIAKEADYVEGTFTLFWRPRKDGAEDEISIDRNSTATLFEIGMEAAPIKMYLYLRDYNGVQPEKVKQTNNEVSTAAPIPNNNTTSTTWTTSTYYSKYNYNAKSDTGYVGLVNQAMTCYLNSLLQTLYMTPEFRNALHRWKFSGEDKEQSKSIPYQLQRLFIHLQTSDKRAVETTDLTKSFGWDSSESWQQHDVQELCRVMFDALEKRFSKDGYERPNLINELYQGALIDYVKCLECGVESTRESHFLDIPLVIKPFGSETTYSSVEEALSAFVAAETLKEDNQYHCEKCDKKCDAHKGLKFKSFPYLLTLQLMRFDFDYTTMHRIKLNDRMSFPTVLSLNQFISPEDMPDSESEDPVKVYHDYTVEKFEPKSFSNKYSSAGPEEESEVKSIDGPGVGKLLHKGPYVYELFSIMVHSGSAIGGHYYAYIKSFTDKQWYCFNDQNVSKISRADIEGTFGGCDSKSKGYYSSMYASSANAYMLMYRRVDRDKNTGFLTEEAFPPHILGQIEEEKRRAEKEKERQEYEKSLCKFRLFCRHPKSGDLYEKKLEVHQDDLMSTVTSHAHELLCLRDLVPLERCRLVKYDEYTETLDQSFDNSEDVKFGDLVGGARSYYSFELFMEIRGEAEKFQVYKKGGLNLKLYIIRLPSEEVEGPMAFRAEQGWTVQILKESVAQKYTLPVETMTVAMETYQNEGKHLSTPTQTLKNEGFYRRHTVFVCCDDEDYQHDFKESKMNSVIDRHANSILLHVTVPPPQQGSSVDPDSPDQSHDSTGSESTNQGADGRPMQRVLDLRIDRRNSLEQLKKRLEEYVSLPSSQFKVYRVYSNNQEYEMIRLHDSLSTVPTDTRMIVRLGRALLPGEFRIKLFLLRINDAQYMKPILESIVHKDMTIKAFKEQIIDEAYKQGVNEPLQLDRFRLRKKTWKSPGTVYLDQQVIEKDIHVFANFEMYVEPLEGPEMMLEATMMQVYVRHWHPSTYTVDPTREVVLADTSPDHLRQKISELSGVPAVNVAFAKAFGSFPCEVSVLEIEKDLDWNPQVPNITSIPLSMYDDGSVLYFKDSTEKLAELSAEKRSEIQKAESSRLNKIGGSSATYTYTRKEKALKIYTEEEQSSTAE